MAILAYFRGSEDMRANCRIVTRGAGEQSVFSMDSRAALRRMRRSARPRAIHLKPSLAVGFMSGGAREGANVQRSRLERNCPVKERATRPVASVVALLYANFTSPDLEGRRRFLRDFGLLEEASAERTLFFRGGAPVHHLVRVEEGPEPRFTGLGFLARRPAELERLSRLPEASDVETSPDEGGGRIVRLQDPDGRSLTVHSEPGRVEPLELAHPIARNTPRRKERKNETVRLKPEHARVFRLQSAALPTRDIVQTAAWYQERFGFAASDFLFLDDDETPFAVFLRPDRGRKLTDHHCLALYATPMSGLISLSFDVEHLDDLAQGGRYLESRGYRRVWGLGRATQGSAIFSYYDGGEGLVFGHVCDGDAIDSRRRPGYALLTADDAFVQWGPAPGLDYFGFEERSGAVGLWKRAFEHESELDRRRRQALRDLLAHKS